MSWPTTKASTTYLGSDADLFHRARQPIYQNIQNVNSIVDTFDFSSATNKDIIIYNNATSKFETGQLTNYSVLSFTDFFNPYDSAGLPVPTTDYTGTITKENTNNTGITISNPDSAGRTEITFTAGSYLFEYLPHVTDQYNTYDIRWKDSGGTTHFRMYRAIVGGTNPDIIVQYYPTAFATFATDTVLHIEYNVGVANGRTEVDFNHRPLTVYKIA
jgi:hypothetical protein